MMGAANAMSIGIRGCLIQTGPLPGRLFQGLGEYSADGLGPRGARFRLRGDVRRVDGAEGDHDDPLSALCASVPPLPKTLAI
jgi:hypothetical protein